MPTYEVHTPQRTYPAVVERGITRRIRGFFPPAVQKIFVVTTEDVWRLHGDRLDHKFAEMELHVLFFPRGEEHKRFSWVEDLAEKMIGQGADRTSMVIGFGGGIVNDVSGFLASIFMRGIPSLQIPTTLLAQVDAAVGGKTGVNLTRGKNLLGTFHQPVAVLADPDLLATLPDNEYRAGLFEIVKCGVIRDAELFETLERCSTQVLARKPEVVDKIISAAVRLKVDVVNADERENDVRRILNFGHTVGHAIEAETGYVRFLHGEAIAWGMLVATRLAEMCRMLSTEDAQRISAVVRKYGPVPEACDLDPDRLVERLATDKKAMGGKVHFVLPTGIGSVEVRSGIDAPTVRQAVLETLQGPF
jgi:3-dehydroquinate synthase